MIATLQSTIDVDTSRDSTNQVVVRLSGQLVARTAPDVRRAMEAAIGSSSRRVVIDLMDVTAVDTAGLMAITAPAMIARRMSVPLTIVPPSRAAARIVLDRVGVVPILNCFGR